MRGEYRLKITDAVAIWPSIYVEYMPGAFASDILSGVERVDTASAVQVDRRNLWQIGADIAITFQP